MKITKTIAALFVIFCWLIQPHAFAQTTQSYTDMVNGSTSVPTPSGTEAVGIVTAGVTKKTTTQAIANTFNGIINLASQVSGYLKSSFGGNTYDVVITNSPYNASGYIALTVTSGAVTSGTTNIPVASSAGFYVGHIVIVSLGGTSCTKNFSGTVSAIPDSTHITVAATSVAAASLPPTATTGTSGTQCTSTPANYIVYEIGNTTTSASAATGASSITLANANTYAVGQGLLVGTGASGGGNLITTITSVNTGTGAVGISPSIGNASGIASGVNIQHDDTAAFQAAVNRAGYISNVNILIPDGFYQVNGAPSGTENSAIHLPSVLYYPGCCGASTIWNSQAVVDMGGGSPASAPQTQSYIATSQIPPMSGVILHTDNTGTTYNVFAGTFTSGSLNNAGSSGQTNIRFNVRNMTFRGYPNPWVTPISYQYVESGSLTNVNMDTGETGATTQPTHTSQYAFIGPWGSNGGNIEFNNMEVYGQYHGGYINEHQRLVHIRFDADAIPMYLGSGGANNYAIFLEDVECNGTPQCIVTNGTNVQPINGILLNVEHTTTPAWTAAVNDVADSNNILYGLITFDTPGFLSYPMIISGALNLHVSNNHTCAAYPLPCDTFSGLSARSNGWIEYCSDCTVAATCAGSGTGALAKRLNGAWVCN